MMRPPGFRKRSRASATDWIMFSLSKQKELSVSVTRTSQSSGRRTFLEFSWISVMRSWNPLQPAPGVLHHSDHGVQYVLSGVRGSTPRASDGAEHEQTSESL